MRTPWAIAWSERKANQQKQAKTVAIYHLTAKTGSRNGGQSAKAKANYIQREGRFSRDRDEVLHAISGNMPSFVANPTDFWERADAFERANGRLFKELEFALPVELTLDQQKALASEFALHLTGAERLPFTLAIHRGGGTNPHCHLMISERKNDGIWRMAKQWFKRFNPRSPEKGGAQKTEALKPKTWLEQTREAWARFANRALKLAGHDARIDHRTLEAQGIERLPGVHLGPNVVEMEARGIRTDRADLALSIEKTNCKIYDLQKIREAIENERNRQIEAGERSRRDRGAGRTAGTEHGGTGGRSPAANPRNPEGQRGSGRELVVPATGGHELLATRRQGHEDRGSGVEHSQSGGPARSAGMEVEALGRGLDRFRDAFSGALDRIVDLAGGAGGGAGGRGVARFQAQVKGDRTAQAISRQLAAMGCESFDIGIRDAASGKMMNRKWAAPEVLQNVQWLKRMNALGNDIFVRPAEEVRHGLVLLDDLSEEDLRAMAEEGRKPALIVETSPTNFQAWLKIGLDVPPEQRSLIARELAREYGADMASADSRHFGRLAGFTNRKNIHTSKLGLQPFVLCRESSGQAARAGEAMQRWAADQIEKAKREEEKAERLQEIRISVLRGKARTAEEEFRSEMAGLVKRFDDLSRCDFIAAKKMAERGRSAEEIAAAMAAASPGLLERKKGHEMDYVRRTVRKAMGLQRSDQALESEEQPETRPKFRR